MNGSLASFHHKTLTEIIWIMEAVFRKSNNHQNLIENIETTATEYIWSWFQSQTVRFLFSINLLNWTNSLQPSHQIVLMQ